MTTSTDKTDTSAKKKPKAKGPIRWEAVLPAAILTALVGAYFTLFFSGHVRRALEYVGTQVNGAEVNIGDLDISLLRASVEFKDIQVTDKNKPARNIIQIGGIKFKMLWDALLRAKIVIDEASILDIEALAPRKHPGYVVPPPPPGKSGPSLLSQVESRVLEQTRKKYSDNFLSDIAALVGGTDPKDQLKNLQAQLQSDARVKALEKELKEKQAKWEKRIKELPQAKDLKAYEERIKALKFDMKKPAELARDLKEAEKIIKEVEQKVKLVEQTSKDVKGETNAYQQAFKDLDKMVQEDIRSLQQRFKIPQIDSKEFSQQLFMSMLESKLVGVQKYVAVARKYMPPKRSEEEKKERAEEQLVPRARGAGISYKFPITTGYPLFWLKHAALSSKLGSSQYSGDVMGEIKDLNSDPIYLQRPTLLLAKGNFPKIGIFDFDGKVTIDHTTATPKESLELRIGAFPVDSTKLSNSPDVKLAIGSAKGSTFLNAVLVEQSLSMEMKNVFNDVKYDLVAKNKHVQEILGAILKDVNRVTLNAGVKGSFSDFSVHINSNLGEELAKGFQKQLQAKIAEAQTQLKAFVDERIGKEREKLKAEMDRVIGSLTKDLDTKKAEVDKSVQDAKAQVDGGKGKSPEKKLEQEGKKLLKGLFGG
ncbi:MAG: TIGR03545 family protein [Bdellovibrionales bacterium]